MIEKGHIAASAFVVKDTISAAEVPIVVVETYPDRIRLGHGGQPRECDCPYLDIAQIVGALRKIGSRYVGAQAKCP